MSSRDSNTLTGALLTDGGSPGGGLGSPVTPRQRYGVMLLAGVAAVVVGLVAVSLLFGLGGTASAGDGTVAVVAIEGPIIEPIGEELEDELRDVRADDSIDAVVLKMDTAGGAVAPTEKMYMSIQRTGEEMPVLASVQDMSASAGYYMMLPAEDIYVLPTSEVGSVGLAASSPGPTPPTEGPSGPDKRGSNVIHDWAELETLGDVFIETVMEKRGDRIELDRESVSTAEVFLGVDSVENGFADEIGSLDDAVDDAAERAGLEEYSVEERSVGGGLGIPLIAQTDHGMVAIHDENPSIADVQPVDRAYVYEPAVPDLEELEAVSSPELEAQLESAAEETEGGDDS